MNGNNKKAMSLLVVLGFFISVLAVFGPVGATSGRVANFNNALSVLSGTDVVTEANDSDALTIQANITIVNGEPNATNVSITLFINDAIVDLVPGQVINNGTPKLYTYPWVPTYGDYKIAVLAQNGTDAANSTNSTIASFKVWGADCKVTTVTSNPSAGLVGITDITFTANLVNVGNKAGDANVTFKLETIPSINLGFKVVNVPTTGAQATFVCNFTGVTVSDGSYNVSASIPGTSNVTLVTLTNPIIDIIILGIDVTPSTVTVKKGETKEVMVDVQIKNNGTMAAPNVTINFYLDAGITTPFTSVLLDEQVAPAADKYVTLYYNFTDAQVGIHNFHAGVAGTSEGGEQWFDSANVTVNGEANVSVQSFTLSAASGLEGENVTMTAKLFNNGTADAVGISCEFVYGTTSLGTKTNLTVTKGATVDVLFTYTLMNITVDNMTQGAAAKVGTAMAGTNLTIIKKKPVVGITTIAITPAGFKAGDAISATITVGNTGTAAAVGVVIDFYDGATKIGSSAAVNISAGSTQAVVINGTVPTSTTDGNHTFFAKYGTTAEKNVTMNVAHTPTVASVVIGNFTVSPKMKDKQPKDSTQSYTLTVVLKNNGELSGVVVLTVKEGSKTIITKNVTVAGKGTATETITWKVKGDGSHSAVATITGAGTGTATAKASLMYAPGFEVIFLAAAVLVAALLVRRRKN